MNRKENRALRIFAGKIFAGKIIVTRWKAWRGGGVDRKKARRSIRHE
ncbi:MAG: hypothetical protein IIC13_00740 [SAR324 cluster bacterium]|nr:hypothetical protein [SAR324 cluster bacterium]